MIRFAREEDLPQLLEIYGPYVLKTTATFEYDVPCRREFARRFQTITEQFPWLVWEEEGRILGYTYASLPFTRPAYAWCAEPTVYLRPEAWGRGIAAALYAVLEKILKAQGYQVLYALVCGENRQSLRFHEKMGYRLRAELPDCGWKFDRWLGLCWLEKRLDSVKTPSAFPAAWRKVVQDAQNFPDILDNLSLF